MGIMLFFLIVALIIALGFIGEIVFKRTNIPDVIWLIFSGIILASMFPNDIQTINVIAPIFTTFALIFIIFEGSLNLNIDKIFKSMFNSSLLSILNFVGTIIAVTLIFYFSGVDYKLGILFGSIIGGTSSAVVVPLVKRLRISKSTSVILILESAITDVLCIVVAVSLIELFQLEYLNVTNVMGNILYSFLFAILLGIIFAIIWAALLKKIKNYSESYMITVAALLVVYGVTELTGSNGTLACLAFGVVLGNSTSIFKKLKVKNVSFDPQKISSKEKFFYGELSFIVKTFFFVYLGLIMTFSDWRVWLSAFVIVLILFVSIRPLSVFFIRKKLSLKDKAIIESLVPKGLAAAVLAQLPAQAGIPGTEFFANLVFAVILLSIILSTILVYLVEKNQYRGISGLFKTKSNKYT
ncbi:MAG: cation:proton antiporter [Candidatus Nanoarchaeia archaeon]